MVGGILRKPWQLICLVGTFERHSSYWSEMTTLPSGFHRRCPFKRRERKVSLQQCSACLYIVATQVSQSGSSQIQKVSSSISLTYFIFIYLFCILTFFSVRVLRQQPLYGRKKTEWVKTVISGEGQCKGSCYFPTPVQNAVVENAFWFLWYVAVGTVLEPQSAVSFSSVTPINQQQLPFLPFRSKCSSTIIGLTTHIRATQVQLFYTEQRTNPFLWYPQTLRHWSDREW